MLDHSVYRERAAEDASVKTKTGLVLTGFGHRRYAIGPLIEVVARVCIDASLDFSNAGG